MVVVNPEFACQITKANGDVVVVKGLASARVTMDREKPSDEMSLEFPQAKAFTLDLFAEDDVAALALGFKELGLAPVFEGPVTEIGPNLPLKVTAESHGRSARKGAYKTTYANKVWADIAKDAITRAGLEAEISTYPAPTTPPKSLRVDGQTPAEILDKCAAETGWVWYVLPGQKRAWFGPRWEEPASEGKVWLFTVGKNVYADDCQLEFIKSGRVKKVVVTLTDADFQQPPATGEYADPKYKDGDPVKRLSFAVAEPKKKGAEDRAREEFLKISASGWKGSFKAVGNPYLRPGARIAIVNPKYDDTVRHATVASVEHNLGDGVYEMTVEVAGGVEEGAA